MEMRSKSAVMKSLKVQNANERTREIIENDTWQRHGNMVPEGQRDAQRARHTHRTLDGTREVRSLESQRTGMLSRIEHQGPLMLDGAADVRPMGTNPINMRPADTRTNDTRNLILQDVGGWDWHNTNKRRVAYSLFPAVISTTPRGILCANGGIGTTS